MNNNKRLSSLQGEAYDMMSQWMDYIEGHVDFNRHIFWRLAEQRYRLAMDMTTRCIRFNNELVHYSMQPLSRQTESVYRKMLDRDFDNGPIN